VTVFVLVHGAFRGGWAWRHVRERLQAAGHEVHTPSLTGMGDRRHLAGPGRPRVRLSTWVDDVVAVLDTHDLREVVLVGHSQGGLVTTAASPRLVDRLARLVYLDAPVPRDGERGVDLNPPGVVAPDVAEVDLDGWLPARPLDAGAEGLSAEDVAWVNARLGPTPLAPSFDPVTLPREVEGAVPRTYVFFDRTPQGYPCWSTRLRLDAEGVGYRTIDADHDAPTSAPDQVVAALLDV
jgi:pimeloyl-ACP methyl ester carboxylesterase